MTEETDIEEEQPFDAKLMWPFTTTKDYLEYNALRRAGYTILSSSHEMWTRAHDIYLKGKK